MEIVKRMIPARKTKRPDFPRPLGKLSAYAGKIRRRVLTEYGLSDSETVLLDLALGWLDEMRRYQAIVDAMGVESLNEKTGASRPNPALGAMQHARTCFLTAWRILDLTPDEEKPKPGRPPFTYPGR
jgi:hypothetical protein